MATREPMRDRLQALSVLGLGPAAKERDVREAHRRLALQYHPDLAGTDALGEFLAVQAAYEYLQEAQRNTARPVMRQPDRSMGMPRNVHTARAARSERRPGLRWESAAREGPAWAAEQGWKGGAWYWDDIVRRSASSAPR